MPFTLDRSEIENKYPIGAILAVKEPYIGLGHTTGIAEIRVGVYTDVERLPSSPNTKWRFESPVSRQVTSLALTSSPTRRYQSVRQRREPQRHC